MRSVCAFSAGATLWLAVAGTGWAGENDQAKNDTKSKETPAAFNKTFEWENKVVGEHKGVDHDKIAAMQEEGRREREAKQKERMSGHAPKVERTEGVNGPATAKLPTMDIEKAHPTRSGTVKRAAYSPPREHDEIDAALAENRAANGDDSSGQAGLDKILSPKHGSRTSSTKHAKRARRR